MLDNIKPFLLKYVQIKVMIPSSFAHHSPIYHVVDCPY